jgi:hypothetical protein
MSKTAIEFHTQIVFGNVIADFPALYMDKIIWEYRINFLRIYNEDPKFVCICIMSETFFKLVGDNKIDILNVMQM